MRFGNRKTASITVSADTRPNSNNDRLATRTTAASRHRGNQHMAARTGPTSTRVALAAGLATFLSVAAYAQFGGPPPTPYTPAEDARDLKSVLFNWPWHMVMLRGIEEHELAVTLEYRGEGTIQVNGQPCAITPYKATKRKGELGTSGYRVSDAYQFEGSRTQIECTLPNGQMYSEHRGRQRQVRLGRRPTGRRSRAGRRHGQADAGQARRAPDSPLREPARRRQSRAWRAPESI